MSPSQRFTSLAWDTTAKIWKWSWITMHKWFGLYTLFFFKMFPSFSKIDIAIGTTVLHVMWYLRLISHFELVLEWCVAKRAKCPCSFYRRTFVSECVWARLCVCAPHVSDNNAIKQKKCLCCYLNNVKWNMCYLLEYMHFMMDLVN